MVGPLGRTYRLENDPHGDLLGLTTPSGLRLGLDHDSIGRITRIAYDRRTLFDLEYDEVPICVSAVRFPDQTSVRFRYHDPSRFSLITDRLGNPISFEYDDLGRLSALTDGNGRNTTFRYGEWSRPDATVFPDGSTESYEYDPNGRVRRIVAGAESFAEIVYDEADRPIEIRYGDGEVIHYAYDGQGNVIEAANPEITVRYEYNDAGQVVKEDQAGQVIAYQYNSAGDLVGLTYPTGETVAIHRDEELRLDFIKDWAGGIHRFTYADEDRGYAHVFPNGLKAEVAQAGTGKPLGMILHPADSISRVVCRLKFQYDAEDRLRTFTDSDFGTKTYTYDAESQLLEVRAGDGKDEVFTYDPAGNRTSRNGTKAEFNALNQLTSQGTTRCGYDARGNLQSYIGLKGHWHFVYNRRNLLVRAESGSGRVVEFGYDAFGRRLWKKSGTKEVRYVWAGEQLIREVEKDGPRTVTRDYLYKPGTHIPLALRLGEDIYCYHTDHLGTPLRMTDSQGRVVWSAEYRAFGEAIPKIHQVANPCALPGQYCDEETGLHYNRFRYYAPHLGRYVTRDPLTFLAGVNFYAYAGNDPSNGSDPLGLSWWKTALSVAAGVVVGGLVLASAPLSIPLLVAGAGATVVGVAAGVTANKVLNLKEFSLSCIAKGFAEGLVQGLKTGLIFGAAIFFLPEEAAAAISIGGAAVADYSILQEHLGWHLFPWEEHSIPFDQKTPCEQNRSLGGLLGQLRGARAAGRAVKAFKGAKAPPPAGTGGQKLLPPGPTEGQKLLPPGPEPTPQEQAEALPGHGHDRHGSQVTTAEQVTSVQTGLRPDGATTKKPGRATTFDSPEVEVDAVKQAQDVAAQRDAAGTADHTITVAPKGAAKLPRQAISAPGPPQGTGSGVEVIRDANGNPLPGRPTQPTGQMPNSTVILERDPLTGKWNPVTQYPDDEPVTPP